MKLKCDDCGATTVADTYCQAVYQGWSRWEEDGYDDEDLPLHIWRCGPCFDAYSRRAQIIEALEDGDYVA
jgi:hypothetical protein